MVVFWIVILFSLSFLGLEYNARVVQDIEQTTLEQDVFENIAKDPNYKIEVDYDYIVAFLVIILLMFTFFVARIINKLQNT